MAKHQVPQMVAHSQRLPADRHKAHGNDPNTAALHRLVIRQVAVAARRIVINGPADRQAHHRMVSIHHRMASIHHIDRHRMRQAQVAAHIRVVASVAAAVVDHTIRHRINRRRRHRADIIRETMMMMMIGTKGLMHGKQRLVIGTF